MIGLSHLFDSVGFLRPGQVHRVIPAKVGIQFWAATTVVGRNWIPAFAGMTS
jgi:hypothetical protein